MERVPILPYRRALGESEHKQLYSAFSERWGDWYGGCANAASERNAVTVHDIVMEQPAAYERLRKLLADHGVTRLFVLREFGRDGYELDLPGASFTYNGAEGFWTAGDMSWGRKRGRRSFISRRFLLLRPAPVPERAGQA